MRSDYALYTVAIIFFILTGMIYFYQVEYRELCMVATSVLGLFFIGLGYIQRPKTTAKTVETPAATETAVAAMQAAPEEGEKLPLETPSAAVRGLTEIKGIGAKRAEQLKALGIASIEDLAKASAKDLASKLKVSPKITRKWIEEAKKLLEKT
ncbi:MAG: helix-hairpin-helix domain-containing protein [Candidatus Bathyarchaeia archaeon]